MRLASLLLLLVLDVVSGDRTAQALADKVTNLPQVSFQTNFEQFAGYLNSTDGSIQSQLHYWYIESQNDPANDPLILYMNGIQCSSIYAMLMNVANLLVIDTPGVGFSPNSNEDFNDERVAAFMENALNNFFTVYPERTSNIVYLAGEGYASVYAAKIARNILEKFDLGQSQTNLQGILIGNGLLSAQFEFNSILPIAYTHGFAGKE
ncbi:unnamed protein product [Strongylus vulgaris]|uniref:Carboxypeptidase n=1 Tax=Strongylus vulgaris TaxID=40348 RepID=A0A3P7LGX4_STRVU|nr:unnamed protein product [Strongylus vulgaris]